MSQSYPAFVHFHSMSNCFGYVKSLIAISNKKEVSTGKENIGGPFLGNYRMRSCDNPNIFIDVQIFGKSPFTHIFINSVFAGISGFQEKQEVILEKIPSTAFCSYIEVAPRTDDDYSVIAQSQSSIENMFLNQIRLVSNNMVIPYFVSPGVHVQLRILNIVPPTNNPVILNNDTELHVQTVFEGAGSEQKTNMALTVSEIVHNLSSNIFSSTYAITFEKPTLAARILPKKIVESWIKSEICNIDPSTLYIAGKENSIYSEHGIVEVKGYYESPTIEKSEFFYIHRTANRKRDDLFNYSLDHLFKSLKIPNKIHCVDGSSMLEPYSTIEIVPVAQNRLCYLQTVDVLIDRKTFDWAQEYDMLNSLENSLCSKKLVNPILLPTMGKFFDASIEGTNIRVKMIPNTRNLSFPTFENTCFLVERNTILHIKAYDDKDKIDFKRKLEQDDSKNLPYSQINNDENEETVNSASVSNENYGLNSFDDIVQISSHSKQLSSLVVSCERKKCHSIVLGSSGCGKSYFLKRLARRLAHNSSIYFCKLVQCSTFKGKTSENIEKMLHEIFVELENKKPSVLLLDDFDVLLPQVDQEQRQIPVEKVVSVICQKLRTTDVNVVLVAQRLSSINEDFVENAIRARPIIANKIELGVLTQEDRNELFRAWINDKHCNLNEVVQKSDGYSISEVQKLATTINVECAIRGSSKVEKQDVQKAIDSFVSLKIGKEENDEVLPTLNDVGGMFEQKKLLEHVIIWPKKFPKLFESVGIPVSKGVLLHGPSGCGKTLLANAMISHSKFSVVAVKGPELLSKYIGASEENVRQVFEKARACAPCILFFDELDSLATKRGSDSTGVTDRVVNQLLTELDGAEGGMKGLIVLGCTSRIDLIDEALLRPGRFDHHVKCTFPKEDERLDILKVLTKKLNVSQNVNFQKIAELTDGWSGADLKLLLTNAQFHKARQFSADDGLEEDDVIVDNESILAVLGDSMPKPRKIVDTIIGQKVTLA